MFRLLLFFEDSYQYLQDKVAHESSWWWLLHNFSQCFLSSFYSLTGYTIIMPSPSLPRQRELALIQKNIFYRFIWTMVESSCVSPHKIYQCHILFDNSYSSSRYQPKSGVSWIPAQIWRSVWTIACIWCSDAGQLHKIPATDGDWCGFYGNGQNTQRRPAKPWADSVDAILHNVHLHANQMYRMNSYNPFCGGCGVYSNWNPPKSSERYIKE